ncbi:MAG: metalloregulator ArsR/SmtB family transcription factor [Propionibacteriaceae bacterium]|nr:winged helix-turn-helix transcriptional regulator [Micropruina sp.]HBX81789.1 transcriptional regulator [Propionibacteriaceae bacterium]HBY24118.1 transcriptional regulator [Propionibacteriaceae bacterium]
MRSLPVLDAGHRGSLLTDHQAALISQAFQALADPTRVRLLHHIASAEHATACICHLPDDLGISQPTLSHHLTKLVTAGLITRQQKGKWAHYSLTPGALANLQAFLESVSGSPSVRPDGGAPRQ